MSTDPPGTTGSPRPHDRTEITAVDVMWGLIYTHDRANQNTEEIEGALARLGGLVDLLIERGVLTREELAEAEQRAGDEVRRRFVQKRMAVLRQDFDVDKHEWQDGVEIDCEARVHLCRAACCRLTVGLSTEDVKEGILRWETFMPYALARAPDGYCVHMERGTCRCTVYEHRPIPCRAYDCRNDERIWIDFEKRIPNPNVEDPDWPNGYVLANRGPDDPPADEAERGER
jgi:hypothetical protein